MVTRYLYKFFTNTGHSSINPGLILSAVVVFIAFSLSSPYFLTTANLLNIAKALVVVGVAAAGETLVIIAGGFDLSVGSTMAAAGMLAAYLVGEGFPLWIAFSCSLLLGVGVGAVNGTIISFFRINPLITTLATLAIIRGLAFVISDGREIVIKNEAWLALGTAKFLGIPVLVLNMLAIFAALAWFLPRSTFGRYIYAIGSNIRAARLSGIATNRWLLLIYIVCGATAAVAGLMLVARTGNARPAAAMGFELDVITVVILGGASLKGGRGTIIGTIIGLFLLFMINNGLTLAQVPSFWQLIVKGFILLAAVLFDEFRSKRTDNV